MLRLWVIPVLAVTALTTVPAFGDVHRAGILPTKVVSTGYDLLSIKRDLDGVLSESLKKKGYVLVQSNTFTHDEALCKDEACFAKAADRLRLELVALGQRIDETGSTGNSTLTVRVYFRSQPVAFRTEESRCENCSDNKARDELSHLLEKILHDHDQDRLNPQTPSHVVPIISPQPPVPAASPGAGKTSSAKKAWLAVGSIGTVLAVAGVVGLAVSIPAHHQDRCDASFPASLPCPTQRNAVPAIALSGIGLGVGAVLAPLGFIMAKKQTSKYSLRIDSFATLGLSITGSY